MTDFDFILWTGPEPVDLSIDGLGTSFHNQRTYPGDHPSNLEWPAPHTLSAPSYMPADLKGRKRYSVARVQLTTKWVELVRGRLESRSTSIGIHV